MMAKVHTFSGVLHSETGYSIVIIFINSIHSWHTWQYSRYVDVLYGMNVVNDLPIEEQAERIITVNK